MVTPSPIQLLYRGSGRPSGLFELSLEPWSVDAEARGGALGEALRRFFRVGVEGGYATAGASPSVSRFLSVQRLSDATRLGFRLQAEHVDLRAFQIVRALASRAWLSGIAIETATLTEVSTEPFELRSIPLPDEIDDPNVYPGTSEHLGFEVVWETAEFSKSRRCMVEHGRPLEAADVIALARRTDLWSDLLETGAFCLPHPDYLHRESLRGLAQQFDETTTEISVLQYLANDAGWNVLANLLHRYHREQALITRVVIE
jgi:hypothetical protein